MCAFAYMCVFSAQRYGRIHNKGGGVKRTNILLLQFSNCWTG